MSARVAQSRLAFNQGEALVRIAGTYATILEVVLEVVQNALDVEAKNIDIVLNRKTRHIAIRDDGNGVSREEFDAALQSVCTSRKSGGKLGRYGIGLISPLGKCQGFMFTSCPRGVSQGYLTWSFVTDDIRNQAREVSVPRQIRSDLAYSPKRGERARVSVHHVTWRTEVNIERYSTDKMISRITSIDVLIEAILERFGAVMRRNDVVLHVKFVNEDGTVEIRSPIRAKLFTEKPIEEVVIQDDDCGTVSFRLYLAQRTTKGLAGKVLVGELGDDYRFAFNLLVRTIGNLVPEPIMQALQSGVFEGEILGEKVKLNPNRKSFEVDDAFVGFCTAIETWYRKHGQRHLDVVKEERQDERYQELGLQSLATLEVMLRDGASFSELGHALKTFKHGTVGRGHTPPGEEGVLGVQDEKSLALGGGSSEGSGESAVRGESSGEDRPEHQPFTVTGPRGQRRTLVKRDSIGLQFSHSAMADSDRLWELDGRRGILHFNIRHPMWVRCENSDRKILQLQETIAVSALIIHAMPDEWQENQRTAFDETLPAMIHLFHESPAFVLTRRKRAEE